MIHNTDNKRTAATPYLSALGAWALAFGCSVGWGSFVMPGNTFLPIAGPVGTALGLGIGALVMLILAVNYHYLMNLFPDGGGTYSYTKKCFGYDHGFLCAWFLFLTYVAVMWANATALPLIARTLLGSTFQFGFHYVIAGYHVYLGEMLLSIGALCMAAFFCMRRRRGGIAQIVAAVVQFGGVILVFVVALGRNAGNTTLFIPAWSPAHTPAGGVMTIFALAPWAYVGFESICHSAAEAKFSLKHTFRIMAIALVTAGIAYAMLCLLAVMALPEGVSSWTEYIDNLGNYSGITSQPTFFSAFTAMGSAGAAMLGIAAMCGIFTALIGNFIALSRLFNALSEDGMVTGWVGALDENHVPRNAILTILVVSVILPFFGRTAISWIVDVTTIGAIIAYAFASGSAWKAARKHGKMSVEIMGIVGMIVSVMFALAFLIPNVISAQTLSTESYFILAAWGILGFIYFQYILRKDRERRFGRSIVAWVVLLGLIIFSSSVWMRQTTEAALDNSVAPMQSFYVEMVEAQGGTVTAGAVQSIGDYVRQVSTSVNRSLGVSIFMQVALIVTALIIMFNIYAQIQKREKQIEVEKVLAEESSRAKTSFLSNMSHEIRTPMNAIIGLDNIALRDPALAPKTREQLEKIGSSAKHLLGLINDILDMSRIESGRMVLKSEEFSFREFLDQINIMINGQCMDKGLHYECHIVGHVNDYYFGDDMKLKQVLINILGNSVKFTDPPGDVTLTVEQISQFEEFCTLRFSMKDTGVGMDDAYIPKIFEAFSQEDATATNRYGGSGLGMAITKNFVQMMNGDIEVKSKKGVGSTFIVTVTLKTSSRTAHEDNGINLPDNLRAMVVDDDEIACEHTQVVLRAIGIKSDTTTDPNECIRRMRVAYEQGRAYQLLLTDYKMPAMNGLELIRAIRVFDNGETSTIILTGYNWDIIDDDARNAGVDGIMAKPLFTDSLLHEIQRVLRDKSIALPDAPLTEDVPAKGAENAIAGHRVLIAEDVEQNAEILQDLLELENISVEHAKNGQLAVEMFSASSEGYYDAILMDVRMPVMDGLTATKVIRALDRPDAKTILIIAMTANVFDEDVERSLQAGMNAHLSKPVEPERLYETLGRMFAGRKA